MDRAYSAISSAGYIVNNERSSLSPEKVNIMVGLQDQVENSR